jgi:Ca2+-binding EF-hand superfamily protein
MISAVSSQDNYNQAVQMDPATMIKKMLDKLFAKADANGDGTVSQDEFTQFMSANPKAAKMFSRLLSATGADSTGAASGTATTSSVDDIFKQIDTNGDGSVSKDELAAAMQKMHPKGHHHHAETQDAQGSSNSQTSIVINLISSASGSNSSTNSTGSTGSTGANSGTAQSQLLAEILTQGVKVDVYA